MFHFSLPSFSKHRGKMFDRGDSSAGCKVNSKTIYILTQHIATVMYNLTDWCLMSQVMKKEDAGTKTLPV